MNHCLICTPRYGQACRAICDGGRAKCRKPSGGEKKKKWKANKAKKEL